MSLALALLLAAATPERAGVLTLDADAPFVVVLVGDAPLKLRVDLDQRDVVELNPAAAARLPLRWEPGFPADLGGVSLPGRQAAGEVRLGDGKLKLAFATHGRECCPGADGAVGPLQLPFATIRWVRPGPTAATTRHAMTAGEADGLTIAAPPVAVQLSLSAPTTLASRAAGVLLAEQGGGRFAGPFARVPGPFAMPRTVRPIAFARPPVLLGFTLPSLLMRTADFGGRLVMPEERAAPGDIVVARRVRTQRRRPVVVLGRDQLAHCTAITFHAAPPTLDLACAPPRGPAAR